VAQAINSTQEEFARLCKLGGGTAGGPAVGKVLELLRASGQRLNKWAFEAMGEQMQEFVDANPWHICFAMGLSWGHLAKLDLEFTRAVVGLLSNWNDSDLKDARSYYMERGPDPIEQSLVGAHMLFEKVALPPELPDSLERLDMGQQRWLSPVLHPKIRPKYIGSWNSTAMFMAALFAQPKLASTQRTHKPLLPPGGPVFHGLKAMHTAKILPRSPEGSELDDQAFEPGALFLNNSLLSELCAMRSDWCLLDVHSGLYMLGTRHPQSANW
jgi:hypothetical protein